MTEHATISIFDGERLLAENIPANLKAVEPKDLSLGRWGGTATVTREQARNLVRSNQLRLVAHDGRQCWISVKEGTEDSSTRIWTVIFEGVGEPS